MVWTHPDAPDAFIPKPKPFETEVLPFNEAEQTFATDYYKSIRDKPFTFYNRGGLRTDCDFEMACWIAQESHKLADVWGKVMKN